MNMYAIVYQATNTVNGHRYIGFTSRTLAAREWEHRAYARKGGGYLLQRAMRKHGADKFVFEVLGDFEGDVLLAKVYEMEAIAKYRPEYNILGGGEGNPHTQETRAKIRAARALQVTTPETREKMRVAMLGKTHSEETKQKLSALWKGKKRSPETIEKMRQSQLGRAHKPAGWKHTPEAIAKMSGRTMPEHVRRKISEANTGRSPPNKGAKMSEETRAKVIAGRRAVVVPVTDKMRASSKINIQHAIDSTKKKVLCVDTGVIFESAREADRAYGFPVRTVAKRIKKNQRAHGVLFRYVEDAKQ